MKELKQGQEVYVSILSEKEAKESERKAIFICIDLDEYIVKKDNCYFSYQYAVPVEEADEEIEWKIGDKVVMDLCGDSYTIIQSIQKDKDGFLYNGFHGKIFRKPTPEEEQKYFRN